jgi:hypothetical protein
MGPWDIMSQHFVKKGEPPPGLSSFTKIRLGWITPKETRLIIPGETSLVFLSPLSQKGETLVIKIPLNDGRHYLIENRQPIGSDRMLPDSGILILRVNPSADEGYGTVGIVNADPKAPHFSHSTFKLGESDRNRYIDKRNNVSIIPLWKEMDELGVLITTPNESEMAIKAASAIQKLIALTAHSDSNDKRKVLEKAVTSFKKFDFTGSYRISQNIVGDK